MTNGTKEFTSKVWIINHMLKIPEKPAQILKTPGPSPFSKANKSAKIIPISTEVYNLNKLKAKVESISPKKLKLSTINPKPQKKVSTPVDMKPSKMMTPKVITHFRT